MTHITVTVDLHPEILRQISALPGVTVHYENTGKQIADDILRTTNILFCELLPDNFDACTSLQYVQISSTGYTQLFNKGLNEKNIMACNARGVFDTPIAEWCVAMMVNLARDMRGMIRNQDARIWDRSPRFQREIRGATAGILGYGSIGRETARLAKAMGMKIHVYGRNLPADMSQIPIYRIPGTGDPEGILPDKAFVTGQEKDFYSDLDFLILTAPLTKKTEGIIGERELGFLQPHTYILNPARGPIIQEQPLIKILREGRIAGAALDTHYYYPMPSDHPLWCFPNVLMTHHISGSTKSQNFLPRVSEIFSINVHNFLSGKPLINGLSKEQIDGD